MESVYWSVFYFKGKWWLDLVRLNIQTGNIDIVYLMWKNYYCTEVNENWKSQFDIHKSQINAKLAFTFETHIYSWNNIKQNRQKNIGWIENEMKNDYATSTALDSTQYYFTSTVLVYFHSDQMWERESKYRSYFESHSLNLASEIHLPSFIANFHVCSMKELHISLQ